MAHELELNENGEARMFYAGETPWHGLGTPVEREITSEAAIRLAGLDWEVEKREVFFQAGDAMQEIEDKKAICRLEDEKILGIVNNSYECIQNKDAFGFLDGLVGEGLTMYHTAGSLYGGKRIFIACKLPTSFQVGPDQIDKYLVAMTSHDGSTAFHIKWTPIRVVCNNTLSAAFGMNRRGQVLQNDDVVSIYHRANFQENLEQARNILNLADGYYQRIEECFNKLIQTPMSETEFVDFTAKLIPAEYEDEDGEVSKVGQTKWENRQADLLGLFHDGIGHDNPDVRDTRWAAYNAVTEYADHHKTFKTRKYDENEVRMNSVIWGHSALMKKQALMLLNQ